jgi:hypothetical protein
MTPIERRVRDLLRSPEGRLYTWSPFRRKVAEWLGVVRPSVPADYITGQVETPPASWSVPPDYIRAFVKYAPRRK